ncbi:MAG: oligosaccharide flippase family protein, partial [Eubacteriales bacterium]|nr:oligosaccharide flippase family protein [Eubacteriales bacterium]
MSRLQGLRSYQTVLKNYLYNLSYQILALLLPIITVPYITRVFSQDLVGLNTVTQANCSYFVLIGMLGISYLGPREIAKCLGNKEKVRETFSSIYKIQWIAHAIALLTYILFCMVNGGSMVAYVYILYILFSMTDISWFFIGIEQFKSISVRNMLAKLISFALLIALIKREEDIYLYICTLYVPQILMNLYMWLLKHRNYGANIRTGGIDKRYVKEAISLFIPLVSSSIYTILDKSILGIFTTYGAVAIYSQGTTLLRVAMTIVPSFCSVMVPRISICFANHDEESTLKYMKFS